jgi:broad specificity phosphatase PhoE
LTVIRAIGANLNYDALPRATLRIVCGGVAGDWPYNLQSQNPMWQSPREFPDNADCTASVGDRDMGIEFRANFNNGLLIIPACPTVTTLQALPQNKKSRGLNSRGTNTIDICTETAVPVNQKNLYFIRHGESTWNKMQRERSWIQMAGSQDNPLSPDGLAQAKELGKWVNYWNQQQAVPSHSSSAIRDMLRSTMIFVSPLTRAVQTALHVLKPLVENRRLTVHLEPSVREKRNTGGKDSSGTAIGAGIVPHVVGVDPDLDWIRDPVTGVNFDLSLVQSKWWQNSEEKPAAVRIRIWDFLMKVKYAAATNIIFVGHSHYFKELTHTHLDRVSFRTEHPLELHRFEGELENLEADIIQSFEEKTNVMALRNLPAADADDVVWNKLGNCGLVLARLDFAHPQPIRYLKLIDGWYEDS